MIHVGLTEGGFEGRVYYINPGSPAVHGQPTVASLTEIKEPVDLCYIMVGTDGALPVIHDTIAAGIHNAVVLAGGFAEQDEHDLSIIGPNCMGYINVVRSTEAMATLSERPILQESVALISQGVGLSILVSTGNEAAISVTDALQYAVEDEATRAIALFMETIREPEHFVQIARQALKRGKPIVALKAGRSEITARVVLAHTGALTGDDRVNSIEKLIHTCAGYLGHPLRKLADCSLWNKPPC